MASLKDKLLKSFQSLTRPRVVSPLASSGPTLSGRLSQAFQRSTPLLNPQVHQFVRGAYQNTLKPYVNQVAAASGTVAAMPALGLANNPKTPSYIQRPAAFVANRLVNNANELRRSAGMPDQSLRSFGTGLLNTGRAIATVKGGAMLSTTGGMITTGLGTGLGMYGNARQGNLTPQTAGQSFGSGVKLSGLTSFTNPVISGAAGRLGVPVSNFLARQATVRGVTGLGNVIEDEILAKLNDYKPGFGDRLLSLGIGAVMGGNDEIIEKFIKKNNIQGPDAKVTRTFLKKGNKLAGSTKEPPKFASELDNGLGKGGRELELTQTKPNQYKVDRRYGGRFQSTLQSAPGAVAGVETYQDENGEWKVRYNPATGLAGFAGMAGARKIGDVMSTKAMSDTQGRMPVAAGETPTPTLQTKLPKANISSQTGSSASIVPPKGGGVPKPEQVAAELPAKIDNFINKTLGYSTEAPMGGNRQANAWTRTLRGVQEGASRKVEAGLGSQNPLIRNAASTMQNFFRGLGMSPERARASMELRGGIGTANERAFNVMDTLYKSLGNDKASLQRINAVLDPELAKTKVTFDQLSPKEQQVYKLIREGLDLVHETSYANGHISAELFAKNRGKYSPRLYEVMELPEEVSKFVTQGKKIANDLYKSRKDIDAWKMDNSLNDPVYGLGKRLAQVETNKAIKQYTDFLSSNPRFVSDIERPGFTKLSDSPAYGSLKGKYVLNSAAEDLKGFFFASEAMNNLYDVFRAYDRMGVRQLQKKLLTVFNPTTNVGNIVSDQVFGFVTGVDPLTLNKNLIELKTNPAQYKQISDYLMRKGIIGTDITRTDFVNKLGQIDDLASGKKPNIVARGANKVQSFYGGTDDVYKASAFKALLDKGFSLEEATRKVADGFQNYANVGKFYDVWAKTPVVGSAFIKFQGDLIRIIKNGAVNNPLGLISFLGTLWGVARLSSKLSGESDEDRTTRENRFAAPMIPGLKIPLTWQTPFGEINAARYISPFFANNETTSISKMFPFVPNIQPNKDVASNIAMNANDPLLATPVQLLVNRDFRGKPISDPKENKYQASTLTPQEKLTNQALFAGRAYLPPPANSAIDVASVASGGKDMYGRTQTVPQAVARMGGIKITQFGPKEAEESRQKDAEYDQYANEGIDKQINSVHKQVLKGEITQQQADGRIKNLQSQKKNLLSPSSSGNKYRYLDSNDSMQTIDVGKVNSMPASSNYEKILKEKEAYKLVDNILDNLPPDQQDSALKELGVTKDDAVYYNYARQENDAKYALVMERLEASSDPMRDMVEMRKQVNGKEILSSGVIDQLYDEGLISSAQKKYLKALKYNKDSQKVEVDRDYKASGGKKKTISDAQLLSAYKQALEAAYAPRKATKSTSTLNIIQPIKLKRQVVRSLR